MKQEPFKNNICKVVTFFFLFFKLGPMAAWTQQRILTGLRRVQRPVNVPNGPGCVGPAGPGPCPPARSSTKWSVSADGPFRFVDRRRTCRSCPSWRRGPQRRTRPPGAPAPAILDAEVEPPVAMGVLEKRNMLSRKIYKKSSLV